MARSEALTRILNRLMAQRDHLRKKLSPSTSETREEFGGDAGDLAQVDVERELESQLASLESRELGRIENAIAAIRAGTYGLCEHCQVKIPVARLQALPHSTCCVNCQRKFENRDHRSRQQVNWESAWSYPSRETESELSIKDIHFEHD